jgi:hypothetical protein
MPRVAHVDQGVLHGLALGIHHRFLGSNDDLCFHVERTVAHLPNRCWAMRETDARLFWQSHRWELTPTIPGRNPLCS